MKEKPVLAFFVGAVIGMWLFVAIYVFSPEIQPERITSCRFAGYDTAVIDTDRTLYCANLESLTLYQVDDRP